MRNAIALILLLIALGACYGNSTGPTHKSCNVQSDTLRQGADTSVYTVSTCVTWL